ncbi:hypothetical protein [Plastoroseomonas hellenica]|uniref:Uncharacterized protein n=1 Tax=Plastoroseomonas hellenica TaxID=2687306 RepID=A0ABS5EUR5_9PROT|nr:hypothetical protein [Plastoroseomonas hellenica]MBR0642403.1 hypothetical protein [Plastoroseomonas hellenica]MBR0663690.1 hypothetical protein [Plastoroseomonas hellenica]
MREVWIVLLVAVLSVGGIAAMNWVMGPPGGSSLLMPVSLTDAGART